jgi:hypothetical protein
MSRPRNPVKEANSGGALRFLLELLLFFGYGMALYPLGLWGANEGPRPVFSAVWILALLVFACARTWLKRQDVGNLRQQLAILLFQLLPGSVLGVLIGSATIGFDNLGFGSFLYLMVEIGFGAAVLSLVLKHWPQKRAPVAGTEALEVNDL